MPRRMTSLWGAGVFLVFLVLSVAAGGSEQVVLRGGDIGADRQVLKDFRDKLMAACLVDLGESAGDECTVEDRHLYVGRGELMRSYKNELLVAVERPYLCDLGGCRLWMLGQDRDGDPKTLIVGAVGDFVVSVSDERWSPIMLFGTYAGARWEDSREVFQAFCISEQCLADFGLEDLDANAIEFPDPLSDAGD